MRLAKIGFLASLAIVIAIGGYMLFRTTHVDHEFIGVIQFHRSWGRVTRVTVDANHDGKTDGEYFYTWTQPYTGNHGNDPRAYREDRNHDGRWDTWRDMNRAVLEIDTNDDGKPDMELDATQSGTAYAKAEEIRGF